MQRRSALLLALSLVGCASARPAGGPTTTPTATPPSTSAANVYARIPDQLGVFRLTQRAVVQGAPADSIFRFTDGTNANVSVIVYQPALPPDGDPARQVITEGEKFKEVQEIRRNRGDFEAFTVSIADTSRHPAGSSTVLEHLVATPVRYRNGAIAVDMQFLYLIAGKFVKVRATLPQQGWEQSQAPVFARALAGRIAAP